MVSQLNLDVGRTDEMSRYGRTSIYPRMQSLLPNDRRETLDLVNYGLAMVDDELDSSSNPLGHLRDIQQIFQQSYLGSSVRASTPTEQAVIDLDYALRVLSSAPFLHFTDKAIGRHTYKEVLNFWEIEKRNFQRRWKVLGKTDLDEINLGIGALVASQFLYILDSPRVFNEFTQLAKAYGLAVKLADNLCDFRDDIQKGFVNIPQENIHHVGGISVKDRRVTQIEPERIALSAEYIDCEHQKIEQAFAYADRLMLFARARRPIWNRKLDERLYLFGRFCQSWLRQAREFVDVETK